MIVSSGSEKTQMLNQAALKGRSLWDDARNRLLRNLAARISIFVLCALILIAIFGPMVWPHKYDAISQAGTFAPPSWSNFHILGTDNQGRDVAVRLMVGLRISLAVGLTATLVSLAIGVSWGAIAGYCGGKIDQLMMRFVDVVYAIPFIFFVILLNVVFGRNIFLIFLAIGAVEWLTMARIVRGQTLAIKGREFIEAARACGVPPHKIVLRHVIPNLLGPVAVYVTLTIPIVILAESFLSFLGLGVNEPLTSLGVLISEGRANMTSHLHLLIAPSAVMVVTLLCLNFLGDGLRDAMDPRDR
ncbi:ABC transporter permease [Hirschia litorea]|uniref:Oligopeptide transport system permease protein OppC n=1 Tax=Hirschia litorea TaxID=1199156 RepID=A0ABW2IIN9_9PROT